MRTLRERVEDGELTFGEALEVYGLAPATLYAILYGDIEAELDAQYPETSVTL